MRRTGSEANAINRVLKARGLPSLDEPGIVETLAFLVEDHRHFMELLRACDPPLRREMYEAMRPHLRFPARPLESYIIASKASAEAAELPVMDEHGVLHPYRTGCVETVEEVATIEMYVECVQCEKATTFTGANLADAIFTMRSAGWAYDESSEQRHLCPECLEAS